MRNARSSKKISTPMKKKEEEAKVCVCKKREKRNQKTQAGQ